MIDTDDRDLLAAEYVLGTLDAAERESVTAELDADVELAQAVRDWERRLSPLLGAVPEVAPPADAYAGIASRLFGISPSATTPDVGVGASVVALRGRVRRWQRATGGFAVLAAALSAWIAVREGALVDRLERVPQRFAAVLQRDGAAPAMLVDVDLAARRLTVRPLAVRPPEGRAYQLWIIDPSLGAPRSLGLVPAIGDGRDSLDTLTPAVITGATYAVTLEAAGGSSTGQPTTAPVLSGKLSPTPP